MLKMVLELSGTLEHFGKEWKVGYGPVVSKDFWIQNVFLLLFF